jgi:hypothetical protein
LAGRELTRLAPIASHTAPPPAPAGRRAHPCRRRWARLSNRSRRRLHAWERLGHGSRRSRCRGRVAREPASCESRARRARPVTHAHGGRGLEGAAHGPLRVHVPQRPGAARRPLGGGPLGRLRLHLGRVGREHRVRAAFCGLGHAGLARIAGPPRQHRAVVLPRDRRGCGDRSQRNALLGAGVRRGRRWSGATITPGACSSQDTATAAGSAQDAAASPGRTANSSQNGARSSQNGAGYPEDASAFPGHAAGISRGAADRGPAGPAAGSGHADATAGSDEAVAAARSKHAAAVGPAPTGRSQIHGPAHPRTRGHGQESALGPRQGHLQGARGRTPCLCRRPPLQKRLRSLPVDPAEVGKGQADDRDDPRPPRR